RPRSGLVGRLRGLGESGRGREPAGHERQKQNLHRELPPRNRAALLSGRPLPVKLHARAGVSVFSMRARRATPFGARENSPMLQQNVCETVLRSRAALLCWLHCEKTRRGVVASNS